MHALNAALHIVCHILWGPLAVAGRSHDMVLHCSQPSASHGVDLAACRQHLAGALLLMELCSLSSPTTCSTLRNVYSEQQPMLL